MNVVGSSGGYRYRESLTWRDALAIYKARFRKLWRVLKLSISATIVAVLTVVLFPVMLGIAAFSSHFFLAAAMVFLALLFSGWLYWKSLKLVFSRNAR